MQPPSPRLKAMKRIFLIIVTNLAMPVLVDFVLFDGEQVFGIRAGAR